MKAFDQHVFDGAPAWVQYATRNAWGDLILWAEKPEPSACGLYFESKWLHRRVAAGFELNQPKMLERLRRA